MKSKVIEVNRYPEKDKKLINLVIKPWLDDRYKKVLKEGNKKRIALYEGISILNVLVENPKAIFRKEGYFHSTIVARKNGLCFPDPKLPFLAFEQFLSLIDPKGLIYNNPIIPKELDLVVLEDLARIADAFPNEPKYYLTKMKHNNHFGLLVFSNAITLDLKQAIAIISDDFDFQHIDATLNERGDDDYPIEVQKEASGYVIGQIEIKDILLNETSIKIDIINIKLIKELLSVREYYYNGYYKYDNTITYSGAKGK